MQGRPARAIYSDSRSAGINKRMTDDGKQGADDRGQSTAPSSAFYHLSSVIRLLFSVLGERTCPLSSVSKATPHAFQ